jgi:hypothetical protein
MCGHGLLQEDLQRAFAELAHPLRVVLHVGNVVHGLLGKAKACVELVALGEFEVTDGVDLDVADVVDFQGISVHGKMGVQDVGGGSSRSVADVGGVVS